MTRFVVTNDFYVSILLASEEVVYNDETRHAMLLIKCKSKVQVFEFEFIFTPDIVESCPTKSPNEFLRPKKGVIETNRYADQVRAKGITSESRVNRWVKPIPEGNKSYFFGDFTLNGIVSLSFNNQLLVSERNLF
ncbi:hypothetical protein WA026_018812 [Henosepilachna vigintioctopunctata]|uniref:Uncharacterized protein n=1 Tax=Henosepilachna vigintioctopunctata TaxID=420089 RepID=A0AAW1TQS2_9CUCU